MQTTISPYSQQPVVHRKLPSSDDLEAAIEASHEAHRSWRTVSLDNRIQIVNKFLDLFEQHRAQLGPELTEQMGRPIRYVDGEMGGFLERARHLVKIAHQNLDDVPLTDSDKPGFRRYIKRESLGVVFIISAWNFPYLIQVNSVIPALLAGNTVLLKPSPQTPTPAEHIVSLLEQAGLPPKVAQCLHLTPEQVDTVVKDSRVSFVSFTGSVANGWKVERSAKESKTLKGVALELGGKDAAYVREDADPKYAAAEIVDGAFFNSGQSCCAIERAYVHEKVYDAFVAQVKETVQGYVLGDPTKQDTTLGPVVSLNSAKNIRKQVKDAVAAGAKPLVDAGTFAADESTTLVAPQVLTECNHSMNVMTEETFGPVLGIMKVAGDEEALKLINDSVYGLTASIWTNDESKFEEFMDQVETGTVFMNRCDYLDPALAWTGVKDSGRGVSLSRYGFDQLTRPKSVHIKTAPQ